MESITLKIDGMHCEGCADRLGKALQRRHGVRDADVRFAGGEARVRFNPHVITRDDLVAVVREAGYDVAGAP